MPSHWSDIGIPITSQTGYQRYGEQAANAGERFEIKEDAYVRWSLGAGAELWVQLYQLNAKEHLALNPHFAGASAIPITLTHRIAHVEYGPLDGGFQAYACVQFDQKVEHIPLVFDVPNYQCYATQTLPSRAVVQLAAFADRLQVYPNESEFNAQATSKRQLSPVSFFPADVIHTKQPGASPQARASFGGYVIQTARVLNPTTRKKFVWAQVRTLIGEVDVVADPKYLPQSLQPGNILWGEFYLSGLLSEVGKRKRNKVSIKW